MLNHDEIGQAMYINLLLRNFLTPSGRELSLVDQAVRHRVAYAPSCFAERACACRAVAGWLAPLALV